MEMPQLLHTQCPINDEMHQFLFICIKSFMVKLLSFDLYQDTGICVTYSK